MKTTIDFPDELYRQVKAKAALEGRSIRELTIDLYQRWLSQDDADDRAPSDEEWLASWLRLGDELLGDLDEGPTAREILARDRGRLEPDDAP